MAFTLQRTFPDKEGDTVLHVTWNLWASVAGLLVVISLGASTVKTLVLVIWRNNRKQLSLLTEFYADKDGEATSASIKKASVRNLHRLTGLCVGIGTALSFAEIGQYLSFQGHGVPVVDLLQAIIWVYLVLQCSVLFLPLPATVIYSTALRAALSLSVIVVLLVTQLYDCYQQSKCITQESLLIVLQTPPTLFAIISNLLVPRRPDLFYNGRPVDGEYSTSYLEWLSFSWITPFLRAMRKYKGKVHTSDLPELSYDLRAESTLHTCFQMMSDGAAGSLGLWKVILRSEIALLSMQAIIAISSSLFGFVPHFAVMNILATLETAQIGERDEAKLYSFLALLCFSTMATAILDSLKNWISYGKLAIRVQQRLTIAVFDKAIRRKTNVLSTSETDQAKDKMVDKSINPISLAAVDSKSVADFVCMTFQLYEAPAKLLVASVFLWTLLGWEGLLACALVLIFTSLGNSYTVKKFSHSQRKLHRARDQRLSVVMEVIRGIQHVKFAAAEDQWEIRVGELRGQEMRAQWSSYFWQTSMFSVYFLSPILLSAAALGVALLRHRNLSATTAFTTIGVLNSIETSLSVLPDVVSTSAGAFVSMGRLSRFFAQPNHISQVTPSERIEFHNTTLAWPSSPPTLSGVNLKFPQGALSVITGATGSGKSLLLNAIIGESDLLQGSISAPVPLSSAIDASGGLAYLPQTPWIERGTLRDNILSGTPFEPDRYAEVLFVCALEKDLKRMPAGDMTAIGTDGVGLSGGQKWRVCLARALYSPAQTLLLDDFFSAVDVHTRAHLHRHALMGDLAKGRTRILVTHHVDLCLSSTDYLVFVDNGTAIAISVDDARREQLGRMHCVATTADDGIDDSEPVAEHIQAAHKEDEDTATLTWETVRMYLNQGGSVFYWALLILSFIGYSALMLIRGWCIKLWTSSTRETPSNSSENLRYYFILYLGISLITSVVGITRCYFIIRVAFRASKRLFNHMFHTILRAPLQWHGAIPSGRILARFSSGMRVVDSRLARDLRNTLDRIADVGMALAAGSIVSPLVLVVAAALVLLYLRFARIYLHAARILNPLTNAAKSPIYGHMDACLTGLPVIRAGGQVDAYRRSFLDKVDNHSRAYWTIRVLNRWLSFRINLVGAGFSTACAALIVSLRNVDAGSAGFALSFTMQISVSIGLALRYYAFLEQDMNSLARVQQYTQLETERYEGNDAPAFWPTGGRIHVSDLVVRHGPHLPPVLEGINFRVEGGQRTAVVGRTGAGKSSLVLALFRILEASQGTILVDGLDISQLKLQTLRGRIAVIPQDPAIFRGTIRSNLDPFDEHEDQELLYSLERVRWNLNSPSTSAFSSPLDRAVEAGGSNLSQGQRQLLCIAREITRRPKILVLDEATSAVDKESDRLIQQCLRSVFGGGSTTLLVVAHRLGTVADFDKVLVLDSGKAAEFGSPIELMERETGIFREMVEQDQEREMLKEVIFRGKMASASCAE